MPRRTIDEARALMERAAQSEDVTLMEMEGERSGVAVGMLVVSGETAILVPMSADGALLLSEGLCQAALIVGKDRKEKGG